MYLSIFRKCNFNANKKLLASEKQKGLYDYLPKNRNHYFVKLNNIYDFVSSNPIKKNSLKNITAYFG